MTTGRYQKQKPSCLALTDRWIPGTYTKPLSDDFITDGPKLRKFVSLFFKNKDGSPFVFDPWQAWLIDHCLERYPDDWPDQHLAGRLRYQQIVISVARQNGKSELATALGFYLLFMNNPDPYVVGLASNADQANIIYKRVKKVIDDNPELRQRFKTTGTRGITRLDKSGYYTVKPAKADSLQGIAGDTLFDEVHLCSTDMWAAMVFGTTALADGVVIGTTTAGDDTSVLLKDLYKVGRESAVGEGSERFGFFLWEAAAACDLWDEEAWLDANPSIACGRLNLAEQMESAKALPEHEVRRFRLNQFVSSESAWLPMSLWAPGAVDDFPDGQPIFSIDRTPSWEHATITATYKTAEGFYTEVVDSLVKPNLESLLSRCEALWQSSPNLYVMDGYVLGDLAKELQRRGYPVKVIRQGDVSNACATAYALIASAKVQHAGDELLARQMPFAVRKNFGDAWRISRQSSSVEIDAVISTVNGLYAATLNIEDDVIPIHY